MEERIHSARRGAACRAGARGGAAALSLLVLAACADLTEVRRIPRPAHPTFSPASMLQRAEREREMNRQWQNRPVTELLEALGRPRMVMNIPGGGMPPGYAVVYGQDPDSGCIDAFAVSASAEPVVRIYHCR